MAVKCRCQYAPCCVVSSSSLSFLVLHSGLLGVLERFMETGTCHEIGQWRLHGNVKTELKSMVVLEPFVYRCFLKRPKGLRGDWKRGGIVCEVLIWLHYLRLDGGRWKPSWQWRLNKTTTSSLSWLATPSDGYQDVSNTRNGLGKTQGGSAWAFYSTLSSNHLILMLLHCLVNQPSIYINP